MTQKERILAALKLEPVCSLAPNDWVPAIRRTAARVNDLKHDGHEITTRPCKLHDYETAQHVVYELVDQDQGRLF